jgi:hypothetical protein
MQNNVLSDVRPCSLLQIYQLHRGNVFVNSFYDEDGDTRYHRGFVNFYKVTFSNINYVLFIIDRVYIIYCNINKKYDILSLFFL